MTTIINNQTMEQRLQIFHEFLQAMRQQGIQELTDDAHNFAVIGNQIDFIGLIFSGENIHKAVNALGWQRLHWKANPTELARQQAAEEAKQKHALEIDRILNRFCEEHPDFVKDDHNLSLLTNFCKTHHAGVLSDISIDHFYRVYSDSPELHRLASSKTTLSPDEIWARQNRAYSPHGEREAAKQKKQDDQKRFSTAISDAKTHAEFLSEMSEIRRFREMGKIGISWAGTWARQREMLANLKTKYRQFSDEIERAVNQVGK